MLKWAGGKRKLTTQYKKRFPKKFNNYFEPFVGGGAVFFWLYSRGLLEGKRVVLNDINPELVNFYTILRDQCEELIEHLGRHAAGHGEEYYYEVRAQDTETLSAVGRAARLMYLNRTCFNGLYRVNSSGQFNVPMGRYKNPTICDVDGLRAASSALAVAEITEGTYKEVAALAESGDLVYFDPPYVPLNTTSSFTSYTRENFTLQDQKELAETFRELAEREVAVRLSNSNTKVVRELYKDFRKSRIQAARAINSKATKRQKITELLISN